MTAKLQNRARPVSQFPKQAVIVIHGMGEQMPMDTIKGFVKAVWETDAEITANGLPNPALEQTGCSNRLPGAPTDNDETKRSV
jgi:hypothetical protein